MIKTIVIIIIILFYILLFVELFFYSIPSVVTTTKILSPNLSQSNYFSDEVKKILNWPKPKKIIVFVLPMVFIYILHGLPVYYLFEITNDATYFNGTYLIVYLGLFLVVFGRIVSHLYLREINKIRSKTFDGFVVSGLYKHSRNPGLIGLYISFLGFFLLKPTLLFLGCFVIYLIHMHFKIKLEEDYLMNKHGEDYKTYLQKTRRYL